MRHVPRRWWTSLEIAVAAGAVGAGWLVSASRAADVDGSAVREVTIPITYSRFELSRIGVTPGETVRFVLANNDPIDHEFIVGDARIQQLHEEGTESHHGEKPGEISIPAGETRSTTVTFPLDSDETLLFGCHLPGHYRYGMGGVIEFE